MSRYTCSLTVPVTRDMFSADVESQTSLLDFFEVLSCPQDTDYLDNIDNVFDCTASCTEVAGTYGYHEEHAPREKSCTSYGALGWTHPEKVGIDNTLVHKCIACSDGCPPRATEFHPSGDLHQDITYARSDDGASAHKDGIVVEQFDAVMQCAEPPKYTGTSLIYEPTLQGEGPGLNDEFSDLEAYGPSKKKRKKEYTGIDMSATRYILEEECRIHERFEKELTAKLLFKGNESETSEIDMDMRDTEKHQADEVTDHGSNVVQPAMISCTHENPRIELGRYTKRTHIIEKCVTDVDSFKPFEMQRELKSSKPSSDCERTASGKDDALQMDLNSCAESVEEPVIGCEKLMRWYPVETTFEEIFPNIPMHWVVDESFPYDVAIPYLEEVEISPSKFWRSKQFYKGADLNCDSPRSSDSVELFLNDSPASSSEVKPKTLHNNREKTSPSSLTTRLPSVGQVTKKINDGDAKAGLDGLLPLLSSSILTEPSKSPKERQDTTEAVTGAQRFVEADPHHCELDNPVHIFSGAASKSTSQAKIIYSEPENKLSSNMNDGEEKTKNNQKALSNVSRNESLPSILRESIRRKLESCLKIQKAVEPVHKFPITEMVVAETRENKDVKSGPVTPISSESDPKVKHKQPRSRTKKLKGTRIEQKLPIYTGNLMSLRLERKIPTKETSEKKEAACDTEGSVGCSDKEHEADGKVAGKPFKEETVAKKNSVPKRSSIYRGVTRYFFSESRCSDSF